LASRLATLGIWAHIGSMGDRMIYALGALVLAFSIAICIVLWTS
jgi:hypothetical protein